MKGSNMNLHLYVTKCLVAIWEANKISLVSKMSLLTIDALNYGKKITEHLTCNSISVLTTPTFWCVFQFQFIQNLHNL